MKQRRAVEKIYEVESSAYPTDAESDDELMANGLSDTPLLSTVSVALSTMTMTTSPIATCLRNSSTSTPTSSGTSRPARGADGGTFPVRRPSTTSPDVAADGVFDRPADLCLVLIRTQLSDDDDLPRLAGLQDRITVEALGSPATPLTGWLTPVDVRGPLDAGFLEAFDHGAIVTATRSSIPRADRSRTTTGPSSLVQRCRASATLSPDRPLERSRDCVWCTAARRDRSRS